MRTKSHGNLGAAILLVASVGLAGNAKGQVFAEFALPAPTSAGSIAAGPDGNLWFTQTGKIGRITTAGVITEFQLPRADCSTAFSTCTSAESIAAGPDGNVWFVEMSLVHSFPIAYQIGRITTAGVITEFPLPAGSIAGAIAAGPDGNLWFTEIGKIGRITPAGVITEFTTPTASNFNGIAAGPDGNLWFGEGFANKIGRITPAGVVTEFAIPTQTFFGPIAIAAGPDGALWFTEKDLAGASKIGRITTAGVISEFPIANPTGNYAPAGIATGPDGNVWFTESFVQDPLPGVRYKFGRITMAGVISEFTLPTADSFPQGIVAGPDGNIWFTEYGKIGRLNLSATCGLSATSLCLNNGRFKVDATWTTSDGKSGAGQAVSLTPDAGYFWFFSSNNIELVVKVLNSCSFNNHYWVFAAGLTNVNVVLKVTDTQTGAVATYNNPQGTGFQPIQDTSAFACP